MTPPLPPGRVAVIGDVGGHLGPLRTELVRLGADPSTLVLPDDLVVVQVGDLVHRGPDSAGVVALVEHYLDTQPGRWVQLVGNHEAQYLREPAFRWPERVDEATALTLYDLWAGGRLHAGVAIRAGDEPWLVTHGGLTEGFWRRALDAPDLVEHAARGLDALRHPDHADVLFHAGTVLGGGPVDFTAGPVWASAAEELVPSWLAAGAMPFSQVHGHSAITDWRRGRLHAAPDVVAVTAADRARAHEVSTVGGRRIVGVDPRHGARPHRPWEAFVLLDAVVTSF